MNYKDAFSIDEVHYNIREKTNSENKSEYSLNNYDYYQPKLGNDFYLKHFIRKLLIDIDVLEVESFIDFHYMSSSNTKLFMDILKHKIIPKIKYFINNSQVSFEGGSYYNEIKLENGFIETEGKILKPEFEDQLIGHFIGCYNLQEDLVSRLEIVKEYISQSEKTNSKEGVSLVKWIGKSSHLAYFITQLIEEGYIEPPLNNSGEINASELSRMIISTFEFKDKEPTVEGLRKYCDIMSEKYYPLNENFKKKGFMLPNSKLLG